MRQAPATDAPGLSAVSSKPGGSASKQASRSATATDGDLSQPQRTNTTNIHNLPDDPLSAWQSLARRTLTAVGAFSLFVNLMMLTMPMYLFQLSDRV